MLILPEMETTKPVCHVIHLESRKKQQNTSRSSIQRFVPRHTKVVSPHAQTLFDKELFVLMYVKKKTEENRKNKKTKKKLSIKSKTEKH